MGKQFTYTVAAQLHHGRLFKVGDPITLTEKEAAELCDHLDLKSKREADPAAVPGGVETADVESDETGKLLDRIVALQAENEQLKTDLLKAKGAAVALAPKAKDKK